MSPGAESESDRTHVTGRRPTRRLAPEEEWIERLEGQTLRQFLDEHRGLSREQFLERCPTPYLVTDLSGDPDTMARARLVAVKKRPGSKLAIESLASDETAGYVVGIGRAEENDVMIPCATVSKEHARLVRVDGRWGIVDASSSGTRVRDVQIAADERVELSRTPVEIRLGPEARLFFVLPQDFYGLLENLLNPDESLAAASAGPPVRLNVTTALAGTVLGRRMFDQIDVKVGRDASNDLALDHPALSRMHCVLHREGSAYVIRDLSSQNGTFVNRKRVVSKALNDGDEIGVGEFTLTVTFEGVKSHSKPKIVDSAEHAALGATLQIQKGIDNAQLERSSNVRAHLILQGPDGRTYSLDRDVFLIGKGDGCDLKTGGFFAPRIAAAIVRGHAGFSLVSLGAQATRNGARVLDRVWLEREDAIGVAGMRLIFRPGMPGAGD